VAAAREYRGCAIAYTQREQQDMRIIASQAADELLNIIGIDASFVISPDGERVNISGRSMGDTNVQLILEKLGGGGHRTIAGAQLQDTTVEAAKSRVKDVIDEMLKKGDIS